MPAKAEPKRTTTEAPEETMAGWQCGVCGVELPVGSQYCQMCLFALPMNRRGVPQLFAGYVIHFNGIIVRTLKHASHSVEWRMAERHGAVCSTEFNPNTINLLVYRPGYERSDKVRLCVEKYQQIPAVPISWMLDSLLQSRQIHPSVYRLKSIPAVSQPTVRGTNLPHHQHPFYALNFEEYAIATSFPPADPKQQQPAKEATVQIEAQQINNFPPFFDVKPLEYSTVDVYEAVCAAADTKGRLVAYDDDADEIEERKRTAGVDLLVSQAPRNKINKFLFSGLNFMLSPALMVNAKVVEALKTCGATIVPAADGDALESQLKSNVTHVVYDHSDKKCYLLITAAAIGKECPGLQLAQSNWVEDCFLLGELLPLQEKYVPTEKLLETLGKKLAKKG